MLEIDIEMYNNIQWVKSLISIKKGTQTIEIFTFIYEMVSLWCSLSFREKKLVLINQKYPSKNVIQYLWDFY